MDLIPVCILFRIIRILDLIHISKLSQTSSFFRDICLFDEIWKYKLLTDYPDLTFSTNYFNEYKNIYANTSIIPLYLGSSSKNTIKIYPGITSKFILKQLPHKRGILTFLSEDKIISILIANKFINYPVDSPLKKYLTFVSPVWDYFFPTQQNITEVAFFNGIDRAYLTTIYESTKISGGIRIIKESLAESNSQTFETMIRQAFILMKLYYFSDVGYNIKESLSLISFLNNEAYNIKNDIIKYTSNFNIFPENLTQSSIKIKILDGSITFSL